MILYEYANAIGQDSHRFVDLMPNGSLRNPSGNTRLLLGGYLIPDGRPLLANSDGDVVLHADERNLGNYLRQYPRRDRGSDGSGKIILRTVASMSSSRCSI